jgi:hypothetical protein
MAKIGDRIKTIRDLHDEAHRKIGRGAKLAFAFLVRGTKRLARRKK